LNACARRLLKEEIARGMEVSERVSAGECTWAELFEPSDFFFRFHHYVQVGWPCSYALLTLACVSHSWSM
jgi:poly(A) polymerase Pap1